MRRYALIGRKLGHSWSQRWFEAKFAREGITDCSYRLHAMASLDGLRRWVEDEGIAGFNVTIPYKSAIMPLLDTVSDEAERIGAVNCVVVEKGRLVGHNTDAPAFGETIAENIEAGSVKAAVVLGSGGAAKAVAYALERLGIEHVYVSRHPDGNTDMVGYGEAASLPSRFNMLVNATPVGMWPDVDESPWPFGFERFSVVYDLIYNPSPTLLLRQAATAGAIVMGGMTMLERQAELSWQLWQRQ